MLMAVLLLAQVAAATPAPAPTPRPGQAVAEEMGVRPTAAPGGFGSAAGKIKLNRSVSLTQDKAPAPTAPPTAPPAKDGESARPAPAAVDPSAPAGAEATWRAKYIRIRDDLSTARGALAAAKAANPPVYNMNGHLLVMAETQRNAAISPHEAKVGALEAEMTRLPEDCRKAGCQPGWLRD